MKLSIVIICWNDWKVLKDCLESIYSQTTGIAFEVIVSDNGSADGSPASVRQHFPPVRVVENGANLGFARGNNVGIQLSKGEYVLILNPDTIIRDRALEKLVAYADQHGEAGAFGCRVLNPDGSFQNPARPIPTIVGYLFASFNLRWFGRLSEFFATDMYPGWDGHTERRIGFQSGCCVMFRREVLEKLEGFDARFFYHFEESDLCRRVWESGSMILFCPSAEITHLGGQSVGRFPTRFALETCRSGYRYFYKHYGTTGARQMRCVWLLHFGLRLLGYRLLKFFRPSEALTNRLNMYRVVLKWHWKLNPTRFIATGEEPDVGYEPLAPAPQVVHESV